MLDQSHPKTIGAFLIGFSLVAGAYTYKNFGQSNFPAPVASVATAVAPRVAIAVTDTDGNGIEDWRDQFVTTESIRIDAPIGSTYTPPETLTGQVGINLFESIIRSRNGGPFSRTEDEVIADTIAALAAETEITLYNVSDISILETWIDEDIRNYGNAMAGAILRNSVEGLENEVDILYDILVRNQTERGPEILTAADVYRRTRDDSLLIPVPRIFLKQHLDLINTYHALQVNVETMSLSSDDPAMALLRIKRYEEDSLGLQIALENMALTLASYPQLFSTSDQATLFNSFNPSLQAN